MCVCKGAGGVKPRQRFQLLGNWFPKILKDTVAMWLVIC